MLYRILADLILLAHLGFILFILLGGLLALRWKRAAFIHLPAAGWGILVEWAGWICPLTPLENYFRRAGGAVGYSGSFVDRYLMPLVYPAQLSREVQLLLGCLVLAVNAAIYLLVWRSATPKTGQSRRRVSSRSTRQKRR